MEEIILDTDIFIDYFRGVSEAEPSQWALGDLGIWVTLCFSSRDSHFA